ncbi:blarina toxin-like [Rhodnius prolixus]|uniref:blarina toxin-like n=1 Tax=Rhodnius prolixus TaxID=13249 RepID=UPI003D18B9C0
MKCVFITGTLIKFEKAPFVVYIQPVGCTGALIDLQWVITAAHCFADQTKPPSVIFGTSDYRVFNYRVHSILVVNVNPKIKHFINITKSNNVVANSKNDLALIKLEKPVQLADGMEILVLDGKKWPKNKLEVECKIIAYGLTESSTKLTSKIVLTKYGKLCGCMHDEAILCAMPYNRSETPCFGDLGGVLVCNNEVVAICSQVVSKDYCKNNLKTSADYERNVCYNYERYVFLFTYIRPHLNSIKSLMKEMDRFLPKAKKHFYSSVNKPYISNCLLIIILIINTLMYKNLFFFIFE